MIEQKPADGLNRITDAEPAKVMANEASSSRRHLAKLGACCRIPTPGGARSFCDESDSLSSQKPSGKKIDSES